MWYYGSTAVRDRVPVLGARDTTPCGPCAAALHTTVDSQELQEPKLETLWWTPPPGGRCREPTCDRTAPWDERHRTDSRPLPVQSSTPSYDSSLDESRKERAEWHRSS